jgi:hypothetical protein
MTNAAQFALTHGAAISRSPLVALNTFNRFVTHMTHDLRRTLWNSIT